MIFIIKRLTLAAFVFASASVNAGEIAQNIPGVGIEGYDSTQYFTHNKAQGGSSVYTVKWKGVIWKFATQSGRDTFAANPERFSPQFGGHCANGLSEGHKIEGDPQIWRIIKGKLYLFFSNNGRNRWASNTDEWIADANEYWRQVKDE